MKVRFFDAKGIIFRIGFLATCKIACDTNLSPRGTGMWLLYHNVIETLANALTSCMCDDDKSFPVSTPDVTMMAARKTFSYIFRKRWLSTHAVWSDSATYKRWTKTTEICRWSTVLAKARNIADIKDEETSNGELTDGADACLSQSLRHHWAQSPLANLTDVAFQTEPLLFNLKVATGTTSYNSNHSTSDKSLTR